MTLPLGLLLLLASLGSLQAASITPSCEWGQCDQPCGTGHRQCLLQGSVIHDIECHVQDCQSFDSCKATDIVFVLDSSASIGEEYWAVVKQFTIDVSKGIGADHEKETRVAMVTYSTEATTHWGLETHDSMPALEKAIWGLRWEKGTTNTADALFHAHQVLDADRREDVKNIVLVITDGKSNVKAEETQMRAQQLQEAGIEVFAIGVNNIDEAELKGIASPKTEDHYYYVSDYAALHEITNTIINTTCKQAGLVDCEPWSKWTECEIYDGGKCGDGVASRSRYCTVYLWEGQEDPDIRYVSESKDCSKPCPTTTSTTVTTTRRPTTTTKRPTTTTRRPTTTTKRPTTTTRRPTTTTRRPTTTTRRPTTTTRRPTTTKKITPPPKCDKRPGSSSNKYIWDTPNGPVEMSCPAGTIFSAKQCECIIGVPDETNPTTTTRRPTTTKKITPPPKCDKRPGSSSNKYIWDTPNGPVEMSCANGTIFSATQCECIIGVPDETNPTATTRRHRTTTQRHTTTTKRPTTTTKRPTTTKKMTPPPKCDKRPGSSSNKYIWDTPNGPVEMSCANGTIFSARQCECIIGVPDKANPTEDIAPRPHCDKRPGSSSDKYIWDTPNGPVEMSCPGGTIFSAKQCECIIGVPDETNPTTKPTRSPTAGPPTTEGPKSRCANCDFNPDGVGYLPDETNCHNFIMCQRVTGNYFMEHKMTCHELYWRQSILSCDTEKDAGANCIDGDYVTARPDKTTTEEACDKRPGSTDNKYIWDLPSGPVEMSCASGTVFSAKDCKCIMGGSGTECKASPMLHFTFNEHFNDVSCNKAAGTPVGGVSLREGAAYFSGNGRVEVGFLKNWFANNPTMAMSVTLWFKDDGKEQSFKGLFSNDDCVDEASLRLAVSEGHVLGQVIAGSKVSLQSSVKVQKNSWTFVALVFNGMDAKLYVNAQQVAQQNFARYGTIKNTQCPAHIGFSGKNNQQHFFHGHIDDVRVYKEVLYDYKLGLLYKERA